MSHRGLSFLFLRFLWVLLTLFWGIQAWAQEELGVSSQRGSWEKSHFEWRKFFFDLQKRTTFSGKSDPASEAQAAQAGVFWSYGDYTFISSVDIEERVWGSQRGQLLVDGARRTALLSNQIFWPYSAALPNFGFGLGVFLGASQLRWKSEIANLWSVNQQSPWELTTGFRSSLWIGSSKNFRPLLILFLDSGFFQSQPRELSTNLGLGLGFAWGSQGESSASSVWGS